MYQSKTGATGKLTENMTPSMGIKVISTNDIDFDVSLVKIGSNDYSMDPDKLVQVTVTDPDVRFSTTEGVNFFEVTYAGQGPACKTLTAESAAYNKASSASSVPGGLGC